MSLRDRLNEDLTAARRARDVAATSALSLALTAISVSEKEGAAHQVDDAAVLKILAKEAKKRTETITMARQGGRQDVVDREQAELDVLERYLPKIDEGALQEAVAAAVAAVRAEGLEGGRAKGAVIKAVRAAHPDLDPAAVAAAAGALLG
ncbi:MAG: GatB/YqeY domain-containing protein [Acidimicrobiales bacterium]